MHVEQKTEAQAAGMCLVLVFLPRVVQIKARSLEFLLLLNSVSMRRPLKPKAKYLHAAQATILPVPHLKGNWKQTFYTQIPGQKGPSNHKMVVSQAFPSSRAHS